MRIPGQILTALSITLFIYGCSGARAPFQRQQQVYQPPRLGAESRFEDGLRRQKNPQNLFSKQERKDMEKMGMTSKKDRAAPATRISAMQADSILTGKTRDTAHVSKSDSSVIIPADSLTPVPADTAHLAKSDRRVIMPVDSLTPVPADTSSRR